MSAAIEARKYGLDVLVVDDQQAPGGQIWRSVERKTANDTILGAAYREGRPIAQAFRACGAHYLSGAQVWAIEPGYRVYLGKERQTQIYEAVAVILANGAQERPVPFSGWTKPGVLTVGAAQILLKTAGQVPTKPVWIVGCGPLPLLYAVQLLRAGGHIAGYLDTTPAGQWRRALKHLPGALRAAPELVKGLLWMAKLRASGIRFVNHVTDVEAIGAQTLEAIRYRRGTEVEVIVEADAMLVHEGVVPNIHVPLSLNCEVRWDGAQDCFTPVLDEWGESSAANVFIAGDSAGIAGAKAALLRGQLAGLRVAMKLGRTTDRQSRAAARPVRRKLARALAPRPFLDALFRPRGDVFSPNDQVIVCRCEEVTAGEIRRLALIGQPGPNQIKAATRAGMGPCQGRQCGYTVTRLLADTQNRDPAQVGFHHIRPPLKPVTLGEIASVSESDA